MPFEVKKFMVNGRSLRGNRVGDPVEREVIVLERNVKETTPALIGLAGFFGSSISFLNRSYSSHDFFRALERISENKTNSFLIFLPDSMTSYYGNQYVNSTAVGNYEDFIVKDIVSFINNKYGKRKIGLFGKSSGGFGSYNLASRHPEIFGGFVDVSGDSGFEYCYLKDFPDAISKLEGTTVQKFMKQLNEKPRPDGSELNTMNTIAMAAFYSPNGNPGLGFDLPFDTKYHIFREEIWKKWLEFDPLRNVEKRLENIRDQKIILQVGRKDEFSINVGMKGMSKLLARNKIRHEYKEYDVGHFGIEYLYEESLPSLIDALQD
ncbi:MAG: alpha/beta hydrolase-fold protein [Thermoplasmata archaeon]